MTAPHIDPAALAAARERLNARLERASKAADFVDASVADLRIVLDALREARRQAFEEARAEFQANDMDRSAEICEALAAKEQSHA